MDNFKLRNGHRYKALVLAVERLTERNCASLYKERAQLIPDIAKNAWITLDEASRAHDGFELFLAAGVAKKKRELALEMSLARDLFGTVQLNSSYSTVWPALMEAVDKPDFVKVISSTRAHIEMPAEVVHFDVSNGTAVLPQATLAVALTIPVVEAKPNQEKLRNLIEIEVPRLASEIRARFDTLPSIAREIGACDSVQDLISIFPAAADLLRPAARETDASAIDTLHALS
ncbi:hypothetical protein [Microvirga tunisiensis]|uniref:Uncharacterized protein n=1 Tax=Microvirga tunisiensis TaxID=2108360 RepID=A0A5N7MRV0_9HYPH|nr:hypothetical protein [Microvirga tunisiensis]MPR11725.1 hypothetical protein [Microvirga tunisiensis]MPR29721.1 hypothetical protein [Microvirga tunisiensis]